MYKVLIFSVFILIPSLLISNPGQKINKEAVINNFTSQALLFPQEKIYLHTDKPHYVTGEKIWLKAYLVNATTHTMQPLSKYVYIELVNPMGVVTKRIKIRNTDDMYSGYIPLPESLPEGNYLMRAYTNFMRNLEEEYFCKKTVYISSAESVYTNIHADFSHEPKNRVSARLTFTRNRTGESFQPSHVKLKVNNKEINVPAFGKDNILQVNFQVGNRENYRMLLIEADGYKKYISIPYPAGDFDVSFYPEGGHLVAGESWCVAFKALKSDGGTEEVTGEIRDGNGSYITSFHTFHDGMGIFHFTPEQGESYYAACTNSQGISRRFALPEVAGNLPGLKVNKVDNSVLVSVNNSSNPVLNDSLYLIMHTRGDVRYVEKWNPGKGVLRFKENSFPAGILHILLVSASSQVLSERLVFCRNEKEMPGTEISIGKNIYSSREHVKGRIKVSNASGKPLAANLSLTVTDDNVIKHDNSSTIYTYLLLNSDLKGYIPNVGYYFEERNPQTEKALDMLMLTHGWRRHQVKDILAGNIFIPGEVLEVGQEISGRVKSVARNRGLENSEVSIISLEESFSDKVSTDENGNFSFNGFEFPDSTRYVLQALSAKGSDWVELLVEEDHFPEPGLFILPAYKKETGMATGYELAQQYYLPDGIRMIELEEVEVKSYLKKIEESPYVASADRSFSLKEIEEIDATCLHELFRRVPGIVMKGESLYMRGSSSIYGDSKAALFIDGVYVDSDLDLDVVNMADVERVDIFNSGSAVIFGTIGGNGVVSITTKKGNFTPPDKPQYNVKRLSPLGYQARVDFYSPRYDKENQPPQEKPDMRTTIFWKPDIKTSEKGVAEFDFYAADPATSYTLILEGIGQNGELIRQVGRIFVE